MTPLQECIAFIVSCLEDCGAEECAAVLTAQFELEEEAPPLGD